MVVQLTLAIWLVLEAGLLIRDRVRGKGSAARDQGTLWLNIIVITAAVVTAGILTGVLTNDAVWQFGSTGLSVVGPIVMWTGLAVRIWAIVVLGKSFRTTVEVDTGQKVVDGGPYRWVRHPSYRGSCSLWSAWAWCTATGLRWRSCWSACRRPDPPDLRRGNSSHRGARPGVLGLRRPHEAPCAGIVVIEKIGTVA